MFSVAYIKHMRDEGKQISKWKTQSLKCIVVGTCNKSNSLLFYHPPSKQILSCADGYKFDTFAPSGLQFDERFDGNFLFNIQSDHQSIHRPPTHEKESTVYIKGPNGSTISATVLDSLDDEDEGGTYTVQHIESGDIMQVLSDDIKDHTDALHPPLHSQLSHH